MSRREICREPRRRDRMKRSWRPGTLRAVSLALCAAATFSANAATVGGTPDKAGYSPHAGPAASARLLWGDTRQQILQRAITLFAGAGYAGVSVRDVAAQVGISAAALFHHFPDKQALYLAAMEHAFARNESGILAAR